MKKVEGKRYDSAVYKSINITGTQLERERQCMKNCSRLGIDVCKVASLSPFIENTPSTCILGVSTYYAAPFRTKTDVGWTMFYLVVC